MLVKDLKSICDELGCVGADNLGVYASEINTLKLQKVCGIKVVKSYADNGELVECLEIQYTNI